jgi:KaiC/GvpD/RAD55 family RecA-like ATPase
MDQAILKKLLSNEFYNENRAKLKRALFAEEGADLFDVIEQAHAKYGHDLSVKEVMILYKIHNPISSEAEIGVVTDVITSIGNAQDISDGVAQDAIIDLWKRENARQIADLAISVTEGNYDAMTTIRNLMDETIGGYVPDDFGEFTTDDLDELLAETGNGNRWMFNIPSLSRHVYGIGPGEFGIVFATPETGKSSFVVSCCAGPGGWCEQGAKILFLGNEETTRRTKVRAYQAWCGMNEQELIDRNEEAKRKYSAIKSNMLMKDVQDWDLNRIEAFIDKVKPDIICLDQGDKIQIGGQYNAGHERLRELYRRLRETAKRYDAAVISVSQASAEAEHKTKLSYTMMEGSKIGKAAESDLIIGIGRHSGETEGGEPDPTRFLTVSKNKLSGWHGTIPVVLEAGVSRYVQ